jgi:hypothetical protein
MIDFFIQSLLNIMILCVSSWSNYFCALTSGRIDISASQSASPSK